MLRFLGKRLLQLIPTLFFVSVIIFGLQQLLPGDPALAMAGEERDPAVLEQIRRQYRLDQPIHIQYLYWLGGVLTGSLGESMRLKEPVLTLIAQKFPVTLQLALMAIVFAPMARISATPPKVPIRGSRIISSRRLALHPPPKPSAVSARPSTWMAPVIQIENPTMARA